MLFFYLLLATMSMPTLHPIHVSVSEVDIHPEQIAWTARIYKDDLLLGLYGKKASMALLDQGEKVRKDILRYLSKHIIVTVGHQEAEWSLSEIHVDPEALWITLHAEMSGADIKAVSLVNTILMEVYRDQKNIVNISIDSKTKKLLFEAGDGQKVVSF